MPSPEDTPRSGFIDSVLGSAKPAEPSATPTPLHPPASRHRIPSGHTAHGLAGPARRFGVLVALLVGITAVPTWIVLRAGVDGLDPEAAAPVRPFVVQAEPSRRAAAPIIPRTPGSDPAHTRPARPNAPLAQAAPLGPGVPGRQFGPSAPPPHGGGDSHDDGDGHDDGDSHDDGDGHDDGDSASGSPELPLFPVLERGIVRDLDFAPPLRKPVGKPQQAKSQPVRKPAKPVVKKQAKPVVKPVKPPKVKVPKVPKVHVPKVPKVKAPVVRRHRHGDRGHRADVRLPVHRPAVHKPCVHRPVVRHRHH